MKQAKNSQVSVKVVGHVAKLARLYLKPEEIKKFQKQLGDIFDFVSQVGKVKTQGVKATSHVIGISNRYRQDKLEPERMLSQKEALSQAKETHNGYFVVKAIFESS